MCRNKQENKKEEEEEEGKKSSTTIYTSPFIYCDFEFRLFQYCICASRSFSLTSDSHTTKVIALKYNFKRIVSLFELATKTLN